MFVPFVVLYPWVSLPSSLHIASSHTGFVTSSTISFLYSVIVSPVTGCTTALHIGSNVKCRGCCRLRGVNCGVYFCDNMVQLLIASWEMI